MDQRQSKHDSVSPTVHAADESVDLRRQQIEQWLAKARAGATNEAGYLLEACRAYLLSIANREIDSKLGGKVGASDLVQDTLMEAHQDLSAFRGETEQELLGWLRMILQHNLQDAERRFIQSDKRRLDREQPMQTASKAGLAARVDSPSSIIGHQEEAIQLKVAMSCLPDEYRIAIEMRNWQLQSFAEIGRQMNRSEDAARKLWVRAVDQLRIELEQQ